MSFNISLPPDQEARIKRRIAAGAYDSPSELVSEALRLFEAYEEVHEAKLSALRADIDKGADQLDRGEGREYDGERIRRLAKERRRGHQDSP